MELLIELIVEFIIEGICQGAEYGVESKKVPMPLRILSAVLLSLLVIGIGVFFIVVGKSIHSVAVRVLLGIVFVALFGGMIWKFYKVFKKRRQ